MMEAMQSEMIEMIQAEVEGDILLLSEIYPRDNKLEEHPSQAI